MQVMDRAEMLARISAKVKNTIRLPVSVTN